MILSKLLEHRRTISFGREGRAWHLDSMGDGRSDRKEQVTGGGGVGPTHR